MRTRTLIVILLLGIFAIQTMSGFGDAKDQLMKNTHNEQLVKRLEGLGLTQYRAEWFAMMDYSDSTIINLQSLGIDIRAYHGRGANASLKASLSDCIVIGTVSRWEYDSSAVPYHTIAYVHVEKFLRSDYGITDAEIPVVGEDGPVGNGIYVGSTTSVNLALGEHVLLFLSASELLAESKLARPLYYKKLLDDKEIRFKIEFGEDRKYYVEDSLAYLDTVYSLSGISAEVGRVVNFLHRTPSR